MMKSTLLVTFLITYFILSNCWYVFSVVDRKNITPEEVTSAFMASFNSASTDLLYDLYDDTAKAMTSISKMNRDFERMKCQIGQVNEMHLLTRDGDSYSYKRNNQLASLKVSFTLTSRGVSSLKITPNDEVDPPDLFRNKTSLILPFKGEWYVFWGGNTIAQNYHNAYKSMYGAFDFLMHGMDSKSFRTDGLLNEDYYAFGKEIIAPSNGKVVLVIEGVRDNVWPAMNKTQPSGNTVMIETKNREFILFAHLKHGSIKVKKGDVVYQGQVLGLCGNSGNSTEPHLHFVTQNSPDLVSSTGVRTFFERILVNGVMKNDYSPVRGEKISNAEVK